MQITLSEPAVKWFEEEMNAESGDYIRFYARYGGHSPIHPGFSLGVSKSEPFETFTSNKQDGIIFYIEEKDKWYFEGYDLHVKYSRTHDVIEYEYYSEKT
ncbi:HesB/YadR/YfhF family protein [Salibacterium aidingense]|uniref:HesB/YadR/YfhF family protein n=1 Tax=Salibacterium aidingense TaxID=384933 RepID=UPI003BE60AA1